MFRKIFFLGLLSLFASFSQVEGYDTHLDEVINEVLANAKYCVKGEVDGKIYLRSGNVHSEEDGLYIDLNGREVLRLSFLCSDKDGCFIPSDSDYIGKPLDLVFCPSCNKFHSWPPCSFTEK